jgi:CheY-like chemotaxis protein
MAPTQDTEVAAEPSRPPAAILVVASNDREGAAILDHLLRRYREDYDIQSEGSTTLALQRLKDLRDGGRDLAIILVDRQLADGTGIELLSKAQAFHAGAMRALLVSRSDSYGADPALADEYARAAALGEVHRIVVRPGVNYRRAIPHRYPRASPRMGRRNRPRFEVIRIVGDRWVGGLPCLPRSS